MKEVWVHIGYLNREGGRLRVSTAARDIERGLVWFRLQLNEYEQNAACDPPEIPEPLEVARLCEFEVDPREEWLLFMCPDGRTLNELRDRFRAVDEGALTDLIDWGYVDPAPPGESLREHMFTPTTKAALEVTGIADAW